ncbi:MAG: MBL fold metallo-hydrolase [Alphaproteobacteria bacterium]|nr:MBL fold metallo-hydrolase [Alphaproteobacteria bacterium]
MHIHHFFDIDTATFTYVVSDPETRKCAIIDPVLDYDMHAGKTSTVSSDKVITYVKEQDLSVEWILETHAHADHLTGSHYLKEKLGGKIGIGEHIKDVLKFWVPLFNTAHDTPLDGSQFDCLFKDGEVFSIGSLEVKVMHTPGHTPACVTYLMGGAAFVGDTIFMPYVGTARTDFPGGNASTLYQSIQKILSLPETTKIYTCHDYPPQGEPVGYVSTVADQKAKNSMVHEGVTEAEYVAARTAKDKGKAVPRLLLPSIQVNLRAGNFGKSEANGVQYIKIPLNKLR